MSNKDCTFTVSARGKPNSISMELWLTRYSKVVDDGKITSVYGFSEQVPLYGGRSFNGIEVTEKDIEYLKSNNIGYRIPLSGVFFEEEYYEKTKPLLDKHHNKLNSIICTNDKLAKRIRKDYPEYTIEASVIKNIKPQDIDKHLDIYDSVVLPMSVKDDLEKLDKINNKKRVILFGNGGCAYNCPSKICYPIISKIHNGEVPKNTMACSKGLKPRPDLGIFNFDLEELKDIGFYRFKLIPIYDRV